MSWHYLRVLVEEYLGDISLDGEQSVQSSGSNTQQAYCAPDKMTGFSRLSRFGMTYKPLTENLGEELLTLFRGAFPVRTLVPQEKEQALQETDRVCGNTWPGLLARYDLNSHSWKTVQCSLFEDLELSLETFPKWGTTVNGELYLQQTLVQTTNVNEFGLWPTPNTLEGLKPKKIERIMEYNQKARPGRSYASMNLREQVVYGKQSIWPTPATKGYGHAAEGMVGNLIEKIEQGVITKLEAEQMLSLPKLENHRTWKKKFPTPQASDNRDRGNMSNPSIQRRIEIGKQVMLSQSVDPTSGQLNPTWVEWLMGWPIGWTDLKPLEMDKSPCVQQQHGEY